MFLGGDEQTNLISDDRKKRPRTAFTAAQIKALETEFEKNKYLSVSKRMQLSKQLKLTETQVKLLVLWKGKWSFNNFKLFNRYFGSIDIDSTFYYRLRYGSKTVEQNGNESTLMI